MHDLDSIAVREDGRLVLRAWHDFLVALDCNQGVAEPEQSQELPHGRVRLDLSLFTVDHEMHRHGE
jgi:hypothetical protein